MKRKGKKGERIEACNRADHLKRAEAAAFGSAGNGATRALAGDAESSVVPAWAGPVEGGTGRRTAAPA